MQPLLSLTETLPDILQRKERNYVKFALLTAAVDLILFGYSISRLISFIYASAHFRHDKNCEQVSDWFFDMRLFYVYSIVTNLLALFTLIVRSYNCFLPLVLMFCIEIPLKLTFWHRYKLIEESKFHTCLSVQTDVFTHTENPFITVYLESILSLLILAACFLLMRTARKIREYKLFAAADPQASERSFVKM